MGQLLPAGAAHRVGLDVLHLAAEVRRLPHGHRHVVDGANEGRAPGGRGGRLHADGSGGLRGGETRRRHATCNLDQEMLISSGSCFPLFYRERNLENSNDFLVRREAGFQRLHVRAWTNRQYSPSCGGLNSPSP